MAPEIVAGFDAADRPIAVEIISPDVTTVDQIFTVFDKLGVGRPELAELAPLVGA